MDGKLFCQVLVHIGYRLWLHGPLVVLLMMFVSKSIDERDSRQRVSPDGQIPPTLRNSYAFTIPLSFGVIVPLGQLASLIGGCLLLSRYRPIWLDWKVGCLFLLSQAYMMLPYSLLAKTALGVLIGLPLAAAGLVTTLFLTEELKRMHVYLLSGGISLVTVAYAMLSIVVLDISPNRIIISFAIGLVGTVAIEVGLYLHRSERGALADDEERIKLFN
jgi:hypothetical protein